MITNFEEITRDIEPQEREAVRVMMEGFVRYTKENPIKTNDIIAKLNSNNRLPFKMTDARLRKITNYIRSKGLLPLIATSNGYYVSYDREEIRKQIKSLNERAAAIINSTKGLEQYL